MSGRPRSMILMSYGNIETEESYADVKRMAANSDDFIEVKDAITGMLRTLRVLSIVEIRELSA